MRAVFSTTRFILTSFVLSLVLLACAAFAMPMGAFAAEPDNAITIDGASVSADALKTAVADALAEGKRDFAITGNLTEEQQKAVGTALNDWCHSAEDGELHNPDGRGTVSLTLPDVTAIVGRAFRPNEAYGGDALKSIALPEATVIGERAFDGQSQLQSIIAPKVTEIKGWGLYNCEALTDVQMPSITTVGQSAFAWSGITTFPWDNLRSIGRSAFSKTGISGVVTLPKATSIDIDAFMGCSNLTGVVAPNVECVSGSAFAYCPNLTALTFGTALESWGAQVLHNGNQPPYSENITLTLAAGQKVLSGGDNTEHYGSSWTVADGAGTVEFGEGKAFCGYAFKEIVGHDHSFSAEWSKDADGHWRECSCGAKADAAAHGGGTATCTDPAACADCGDSYGEVDQDNHDWGEWEHDGAYNHVRHCNRDSWNHFEGEAHSGGAPTCTEAAACTVCSGHYLDISNHADYGVTEWRYMSERSHYRLCLGCNTNESVAAHSGGTATCTERARCAVCGGSYGEVNPDNHDWGEWRHDGAGHWRECSCGAKSDEAAHGGGTATCEDKAACSVCGIAYDEALGHDWGNWISNNDGTHARTCANDASHTETNDCFGGTATCTERAECSVCAAEYGEIAEHAFENGRCAACGAADPSRSPEAAIAQAGDGANASLWATLLLASGATVVLAVAGIKRRIAADGR